MTGSSVSAWVSTGIVTFLSSVVLATGVYGQTGGTVRGTVVDDQGVVRHHHLGPVSSTHLWASLAEVRRPGSVPDGCSAS